MRNKLYITLILLFWVQFFSCAQNITIKGKISDTVNDPVPYATLYFPQFKEYSTSNEDGDFAVNLKSLPSLDSIQVLIRHVSYKPYSSNIANSSNLKLQFILLDAPRYLEEVAVNDESDIEDIDAKQVIKNAVNSIRKNYGSSKGLIEGYFSYNNVFRSTDFNKEFLLGRREAVISVLTPGANESLKELQTQTHEVRNTVDYRTLVEPFKGKDKHTGFIPTAPYETLKSYEKRHYSINSFLILDPTLTSDFEQIINQYRERGVYNLFPKSKLDTEFIKNHLFKLDDIVYDQYGQDSLYVIKVLPSKRNKKINGVSNIPLGKVHVSVNDWAVVRYEYGIFDNPKYYEKRRNQVLRSAGQLNFKYKITAEYVKVNDTYYLSTLQRDMWDFTYWLVSTGQFLTRLGSGENEDTLTKQGAALLLNETGVNSLYIKQKFFVQRIYEATDQIDQRWNSNRVRNDLFESDELESNSSFWSGFSYPPESSSEKALRKDLENRIALLKKNN